MSARAVLAVSLAALAALAVAALVVPSASAQTPGVVPAEVTLVNPQEIPYVLHPGSRTQVDLVVRYYYTTAAAATGETQVSISAGDGPDWLGVQFVPSDSWEMDLPPHRQSVTHNVTMVLDTDRDAPAVMPASFNLHLVAEKNGAIARAANDYHPHVEAAFVPRLTIDLVEHPVMVRPETVKSTTFSVTNLGNAPVVPNFRLSYVPADVQAGVSSEGRILGTETEHEEHSVRSDVTLLIKDLGGDWVQDHVTVEVDYRPTRRPDHPAAFQTIRIQLVRPLEPLDPAVAGGLVVLGVGLLGGGWMVRRRSGPSWPDDLF